MDKPNACCNDDANLTVPVDLQPPDRPEVVVRRCAVCGCRHFEVTLNPGQLGLAGATL